MGRISNSNVGTLVAGIAGQAFTVLFGRGVIRVAQFVAFLILAKALTPSDFGWYGILTSAVALAASLGSLGLRQSFAYEIGNGRITAGQAVGTSIIVWPLITALSAGVIFLIYGSSVDGLSTWEAAAIITVGVAGALLVTLMQGVFLGRGTIWAFSLSEAIPQLVLAAGVVIASIASILTLTQSLWLQSSGFLLAGIISVLLALNGGNRIGTSFRRILPMLGYGIVFAVNVFMIMLSTRLAMFIIEANDGADAAGQFFAAVRVNEIFLEAATAVGMVLFSRAAQSTDSESSIRRGAAIASWMFWFFLALAGVVALSAPVVVQVLLGPAYAEAVPVLQILALSLAPTAASRVIYPSIAGSGKPLFGTPMILASLILNLVLALALVPVIGGVGGAIAIVVSQFALYIGYAATCRMRYGIRMRDIFVPDLGEIGRLRRRRRNDETSGEQAS
jgi:O-antigen/teichoic acid export membrane protein